MFPTPDTTMVAGGLARLTSRYRDQPNARALLSVYLSACQELSDALWDVIQMRWLVFAAGGTAGEQGSKVSDQLDTIGALVGQPRTGLTNGLYGMIIYLRIQANRSQGRAEDIIRLAAGLELVGKRLGQNVSILPPPGTNSFTNTTAPFVQPAALANVAVAVGSTAWLFVGELLDVVGGGAYTVVAIDPVLSVATLRNTGAAGNAAAGTLIAQGSEVTGSLSVNYAEAYPASFVVEILDLSIPPIIAISILSAAKPLGVNAILHYSDEPIGNLLQWTSRHDPSAGHGVWQSRYAPDPPGILPLGHWCSSVSL
jgi:hypothetical protein